MCSRATHNNHPKAVREIMERGTIESVSAKPDELVCDCVKSAKLHFQSLGVETFEAVLDEVNFPAESDAVGCNGEGFNPADVDEGGTGYIFPSLTRTRTTHGPHPGIPFSSRARLRDFGIPLDAKGPGAQRCHDGSHLCSCTPEIISFSSIDVGHCVQVSTSLVNSNHEQLHLVAHEVVEKIDNRITLRKCTNSEVQILISPPSDGTDSYGVDPQSLPVYFYKAAFIPDPTLWTEEFELTEEYAIQAKYMRRVHGMRCMFKKCVLSYDGAEDGMFRFSKKITFCNSIFHDFEQQLLTCRQVSLCIFYKFRIW